jgi:hypothetical protein
LVIDFDYFFDYFKHFVNNNYSDFVFDLLLAELFDVLIDLFVVVDLLVKINSVYSIDFDKMTVYLILFGLGFEIS